MANKDKATSYGSPSLGQTGIKKPRKYDLFPASAGVLTAGSSSGTTLNTSRTKMEGRATAANYSISKRKGITRSPLKISRTKGSKIPTYRYKKGSGARSRTKETGQSIVLKPEVNINKSMAGSSVSSAAPTSTGHAGLTSIYGQTSGSLSSGSDSHATKVATSTPNNAPSRATQGKRSRLPLGADNWRNGGSVKKSAIKGKGIGKGGARKMSKKQSLHSHARKGTSVSGVKPASPISPALSPPTSMSTRSSSRRSTIYLLENTSPELQLQEEEGGGSLALEDLEPMGSESSTEEEEEEEELEEDRSGVEEEKTGRRGVVGGLSRSLLRNLFCLYSKRRLTRGAMELVLQFTDTYLRQLSEDMDACAGNAGRKRITMDDVITLLWQQNTIRHQQEWVELVHSHLPLDYAQLLLPCTLIRNH